MLIHYVSEIDRFLQAFDRNHTERSKSQQKEQAKYRRVYLLRDTFTDNTDFSKIVWENF